MLYAVAERGIPLIAISGNHNSAERIIPAAKLMRSAGIYQANSVAFHDDAMAALRYAIEGWCKNKVWLY